MRSILVFLLCVPLVSPAADKLLVQIPATLDPAAPIVESVKRECGVESLVGNHVFQKVQDRSGGAEPLSDASKVGASRWLQLTILSVHGVGGGSWSGVKSMTIRAQVLQNDQVLGTTILRRQSKGGFFGGVMGTCAILERISLALGQDVANWMLGGMKSRAALPPESVTAAEEKPANAPGGAVVEGNSKP
jgi:hypothetical protein